MKRSQKNPKSKKGEKKNALTDLQKMAISVYKLKWFQVQVEDKVLQDTLVGIDTIKAVYPGMDNQRAYSELENQKKEYTTDIKEEPLTNTNVPTIAQLGLLANTKPDIFPGLDKSGLDTEQISPGLDTVPTPRDEGSLIASASDNPFLGNPPAREPTMFEIISRPNAFSLRTEGVSPSDFMNAGNAERRSSNQAPSKPTKKEPNKNNAYTLKPK